MRYSRVGEVVVMALVEGEGRGTIKTAYFYRTCSRFMKRGASGSVVGARFDVLQAVATAAAPRVWQAQTQTIGCATGKSRGRSQSLV